MSTPTEDTPADDRKHTGDQPLGGAAAGQRLSSPVGGRLVLTDTQWMNIVDGTREGGLVKCCVNVEALREDLILVAEDGGVFDEWTASRLRVTLGWVVREEHDYQVPPVVDLVLAQLKAQGHVPQLPDVT